ncbi:MAG TPA: prephenate dehydrogenase/arogenate dehydrogenase family protein [Thermoleophilaceae bacterium]|nr:prephenate dehydrogenase/arogenate dehydrogenase family protein [Thermoleophilaceae bacterium]
MRIAILGVGLIGGSIALAARRESAEVTGWDPDPAVLSSASELGALDSVANSVADAVHAADVAFACAPVGALPELTAEALAAAPPDCAVTDVGSTKRSLAAATDDERFVGGHPIAGAESSGVAHARADLFQGAAWYLTPGERSSGVLYERLHGILVSFGARPIAIDAETHDSLMAVTSHLPHVLADAMLIQAGERLGEHDSGVPRVGPSLRDATRVAGANPGIWTDIFMSNATSLAQEVRELGAALESVAGWLEKGDAERVRDWHGRARDERQRLLEADLAGGPVDELRVSVPNRPGIVAQVALALGRGGVNIADMALAPAPDNRTGSITLWVVGEGAGARAAELIGKLGFQVAERA